MKDFFCLKPWENILIDVTGDCYFCCYIDHKKGLLGNVTHQDIEEIWNSPKARKIRTEISRGKLPFECKQCSVYAYNKQLSVHNKFNILNLYYLGRKLKLRLKELILKLAL